MLLLGTRLKELRKKAKMTQQQLGDLINVTKVSICCYENGNRTPSLDTLIDLSNVFKVDVDYFLGNDTYVISEDSEEYSIKMASEEIKFIEELRKNENLYQKAINDPKRMIELIDKKLR